MNPGRTHLEKIGIGIRYMECLSLTRVAREYKSDTETVRKYVEYTCLSHPNAKLEELLACISRNKCGMDPAKGMAIYWKQLNA